MSILTLPPEIIEQVLISTAAAGFPHAIAAFAQTSKSNHALVSDTKDQHLWREVFLTTFDDPRASGGGPGWGECVSSVKIGATTRFTASRILCVDTFVCAPLTAALSSTASRPAGGHPHRVSRDAYTLVSDGH